MAELLEQIEGTVEDIIYENTDNGYTVFEVSGGGVVTVVCGIVGGTARGRKRGMPRPVREPRHLWPPVPRTGVRDRYAEGSGSGVRLPGQPVTAVHRGQNGG